MGGSTSIQCAMMKRGYISNSKWRLLWSIVVYTWKYNPFSHFIGPQSRNDQLNPIKQNSVLCLPISKHANDANMQMMQWCFCWKSSKSAPMSECFKQISQFWPSTVVMVIPRVRVHCGSLPWTYSTGCGTQYWQW